MLTRFLIVANDPGLRVFITYILEETLKVKAVAEAATWKDAVRLARELRPDIVLGDVGVLGPDDVPQIRSIKAERPETRVVLLTSVYEARPELVAGKVGADAVIDKEALVTKLWGSHGLHIPTASADTGGRTPRPSLS